MPFDQVVAPRDYMRARHNPKFPQLTNAGKANEVRDGVSVCAFGVRIIEIAKPLNLRRDVGQLLKLGCGQKPLFLVDSDEGFCRIHWQKLLLIKSIIKSKAGL